jgi:uncharacterized membrane protein
MELAQLTPMYLSAAVLVAVSISPMARRRRRFVEARTGYVKFTEQRRRKERRVYTTAGLLFAAFMLLARPLGSLQHEAINWVVGPDALIAWLLALVVVALGVIVEAKRTIVYAAVLVVTGAIAVMADSRFGWPLLVSGVVIFLTGSVMTRRFVNRHPRTETP